MALSKTTQDHDEIREWADRRGAKPAEVKSTHNKNEPGILRFCFPDAPNQNNENLWEISWDEFFEKFDENGLELIFQEKTAEGAESNFNKLIYPGDEHAQKSASRSGSHSGSAKSSSHASSNDSKSSHSNSDKSSGRSSSGGSKSSSHGSSHKKSKAA